MCRFKSRFLIALLTFGIGVLFISGWRHLSTPQSWNDIHLGAARQDVLQKLGTPSQDWGDIKDYFWNNNELTGHQELQVYFTDDKVSSLHIKRYIGTTEHFYVQHIRFEPGDIQPKINQTPQKKH